MRKDVFFDSTLKLDLYLIGYKNKGESIFFTLSSDENIVFSGLIDCYRYQNQNEAVKLIKENGIEHLDFVCWTHPHEDHTKGMENIIRNYCDKDTFFWFPIPLQNNKSLNEEARSTYSALFDSVNNKRNEKMHVNAVLNDSTLETFLCRKSDGINNYRFMIKSFAPFGELILDKYIKNMESSANLISIGLYINIGEISIMLAGDVENNTFKTIPPYYYHDYIDYIKIPHHSSMSSINLLDMLKVLNVSPPSIATTTSFRSNRLPDINAINKYINWNPKLQIYCTESICESENIYDYGVIKTTFEILPNENKISTILIKNAKQLS